MYGLSMSELQVSFDSEIDPKFGATFDSEKSRRLFPTSAGSRPSPGHTSHNGQLEQGSPERQTGTLGARSSPPQFFLYPHSQATNFSQEHPFYPHSQARNGAMVDERMIPAHQHLLRPAWSHTSSDLAGLPGSPLLHGVNLATYVGSPRGWTSPPPQQLTRVIAMAAMATPLANDRSASHTLDESVALC